MLWVQILNLPIEYYNRLLLLRIGNKTGQTIHVDETTKEDTRAKYVYLSIEMDLIKTLISKFYTRKIWHLEYESICIVCFHFGVYSHNKEIFTLNRTAKKMVVGTLRRKCSIQPEIIEQYGSWMSVKRPRRNLKSIDSRKQLDSNQKENLVESTEVKGKEVVDNMAGSHFSALSNLKVKEFNDDTNMAIIKAHNSSDVTMRVHKRTKHSNNPRD